MKRYCVMMFWLLPTLSFGQALSTLNINYWYDPQCEVQFDLYEMKTSAGIEAFYTLKTTSPAEMYSIAWERRENFTQRDGTALEAEKISPSLTINEKRGQLSFSMPDKPWILVAKISRTGLPNPYYFFRVMESNYPVTGWVESKTSMITRNYLTIGEPYTLMGSANRYFVSYYDTDFPAASPPFAEKEGRVDRFLFHDSLFVQNTNTSFSLKQRGLYLFQQDTTLAEGFAFRAVTGTFPRFTRIEDLGKPLIYVTTPDEYAEIEDAKNDKAKLDKVILDITRDKERAKNFMRSYFRRVELANLYFSSYKDGWKTDRGMVYTIFGMPDEVSRNAGSEVWFYKTYRTRLTFVKSGSVYNPENYALLRDKRFMEPWFTAVDLWRKSRF